MANETQMAAVGADALAEVKRWVAEQTPTVDAQLSATSTNAIQNKAVKEALDGYVLKSEAAAFMGAVLRISFAEEFLGQTYNITDGGDVNVSGTVPATLLVNQTVQPVGETEYTIRATPIGETEASEVKVRAQYYGIYPARLDPVPPPPPFEIVSWADGTDEQIAALIAAADAGAVDLAADCGWQVGDIRTITIGAMTATGVGESHASQQVRLVLSHAGATPGISRADGGTIHFQVDQYTSLVTPGYMNSSNTNAGSWEGSARRTWCNNVYYNAIPAALRPIFKKMKVETAETYNGTTVKETEDFFALRAEREVFGARTYANQAEHDALGQVKWYETSANRKKLLGNSGSTSSWWERSPYASGSTYFCTVYSNGNADYYSASNAYGLAPFGCI